ncbi:MAG TPA: hypothetical protein VJ780_06845 [Flavobacterium sp.]|nr:hypothetical protein [Flavobacterium sp.]
MTTVETEKFQEALKVHINSLKNLPEYNKDIALKRIVEILGKIDSKSDLKKQKNLINRIAIDSVENWTVINKIVEFLNNNT